MLGQPLLEQNALIHSECLTPYHSPEFKVNIKTCCFLCVHVHIWVHVHMCACWGHRTTSGAIPQEPSTLFYYQDKLSHQPGVCQWTGWLPNKTQRPQSPSPPVLGVQACAPTPDFSTRVLGAAQALVFVQQVLYHPDFLLSSPKPWWGQQKDRLTGTGTISCLPDLLFSFP